MRRPRIKAKNDFCFFVFVKCVLILQENCEIVNFINNLKI